MTFTRFMVGVALGIALGITMFLVGGITWTPPAPKCPGCAILVHPYPAKGCNVVVQGGYTC